MIHPIKQPCALTYARITAHCSIRRCTRTGNQLRLLVGATGDITSLSPEVVRSKFANLSDQRAALYNLALADFIKRQKRGSEHDEA